MATQTNKHLLIQFCSCSVLNLILFQMNSESHKYYKSNSKSSKVMEKIYICWNYEHCSLYYRKKTFNTIISQVSCRVRSCGKEIVRQNYKQHLQLSHPEENCNDLRQAGQVFLWGLSHSLQEGVPYCPWKSAIFVRNVHEK